MHPQETQKQNQNITLDSKSKLLFAIVAFLIIGSVAATFWRYIVKRDYIVQAQTDCDPETQNCFVWECDPNSTEDGEACTGDPEEDIWYYKIVRRNAKNTPLCDPNDEECTALVCEPDETDCSEELCTAENVPQGEVCNDPEQYLLENPPEDEEEECAEDDEECLAEQEAATECAEDDEECLAEEDTKEEAACEEGDEECMTEKEESAEESSAAENGNMTDETTDQTDQPAPAASTPQLEPM